MEIEVLVKEEGRGRRGRRRGLEEEKDGWKPMDGLMRCDVMMTMSLTCTAQCHVCTCLAFVGGTSSTFLKAGMTRNDVGGDGSLGRKVLPAK
jgi:hypothetical protein